MLGLTQQDLATALGITYQQQHKYEQGINRISAARLYHASEVLGVPVGSFFDGFGDVDERGPPRHERRSLEMSRAFADIPEMQLQAAILEMARALAETRAAPQESERVQEESVQAA
jgi:transcriptional regulator with XRE-family HTH domain